MADRLLERLDFSAGWLADADAVQCPPNAVLRADNLTWDEGVPALRPGAKKLATLADGDVHSLYTAILNGMRYRLAGAGNTVYANGAALSSVSGSGDVAFGSAFGQVLFARGTSTYRYDGALHAWGVAAPSTKPTVAAVSSDGKVFSDGSATEWAADEQDATHPMAAATGHDGAANGATAAYPDPTTKRLTLRKLFLSGATDFTTYDAGGRGSNDDLISFYFYQAEPTNLVSVTVTIDAGIGDFADDYYQHTFSGDETEPLTPNELPITPTASGPTRHRVGAAIGTAVPRGTGTAVPRGGTPSETGAHPGGSSTIRPEQGSWSKLTVRRGQFTRIGTTSGRDWSTITGIRFTVLTTASSELRIDDMRITQNRLSGTYRWLTVNAVDTGTYVALSAPSPLSDEVTITSQAATITVPASSGTACWVFRMGGLLDGFYRVAVLSGAGGTITDTKTDVDALTDDLKLEVDNTTPPANIIGIAGPYYDRVFCLTSDGMLWPSRRRNPDSYATGQAIRVAGTDETVYWVRKALGGIYVGTSKDIYTIDGTGAENPDGTIDFLKRNLNIDHPPINDAVAQDGNQLIYCGVGGWRAIAGAGSQALAGPTSLLYQGQVRHGVGPVNLTTGRFRATIGNRQLVAITPESTETTSTGTIYRYAPHVSASTWYRHTYPTHWRSIHTEPDGTVILGDTSAQVWQLDAPNYTHGDDGTAIPVRLWTSVDADGTPFVRKDPLDLRVSLASGVTGAATVALHLDGSDLPVLTAAMGTDGVGTFTTTSLESLAQAHAFRRAQLRVTHSALDATNVFTWFGYGLMYRPHPVTQLYTEAKPDSFSLVRRRFAGLGLQVDTLGQPATVTPILDGVALTPVAVTTQDALNRHVDVANVIGRDLWLRISSATGFELYGGPAPVVIQELPALWFGGSAPQIFSSDGVKTISGCQLRVCTLGATATFTLKADGRTVGTFTGTSTLDDPIDLTFDLVTAVEGTEFTLSTSVDVELYAWKVLVTARRPLGLRTFDSGPIDLGDKELVWLRRIDVKARVAAPLSITAYLDGRVLTTVTSASLLGDTIVPIDFGRGVKGKSPRLVISSTQPFYPYWAKVLRRTSGYGGEKPILTVPFTVDGEGHGVA